MRKDEMHEWLRSLDKADRLPTWVISYNRFSNDAPFLEMARRFERTDDINVLVRESQRIAYQGAYPELVIHGLDDDLIPSCGEARWGAADLAYGLGEDAVLMFDDDVTRLGYLFQSATVKGRTPGAEISGHNGKADLDVLPDGPERVLSAMSELAGQVFEQHPHAVIGGPLKQHMSFSPERHRTRYTLNGAVTPRQAMVWHLDRMDELGIRLNQEHFGVHGEDIGLMAAVLAAGGDSFALPSLVYDHWPEAVNIEKSQIRNASNAAALHAHEWACIQQYPIKDYIRVKTDLLGNYEWGDVDWRKLHKLRGTSMIQAFWDEASELI